MRQWNHEIFKAHSFFELFILHVTKNFNNLIFHIPRKCTTWSFWQNVSSANSSITIALWKTGRRFELTLVQNSEDKIATLTSFWAYVFVWSAKGLCFNRLPLQHCHLCSLKGRGIDLSKSSRANDKKEKAYEEICFVQKFEALSDKEKEMDNIDLMLHCICLRRQRTKKRSDELSSASRFGLVPIDSTTGSVQIVQRTTMIALTSEGYEQSITHFETLMKQKPGKIKRFTQTGRFKKFWTVWHCWKWRYFLARNIISMGGKFHSRIDRWQ